MGTTAGLVGFWCKFVCATAVQQFPACAFPAPYKISKLTLELWYELSSPIYKGRGSNNVWFCSELNCPVSVGYSFKMSHRLRRVVRSVSQRRQEAESEAEQPQHGNTGRDRQGPSRQQRRTAKKMYTRKGKGDIMHRRPWLGWKQQPQQSAKQQQIGMQQIYQQMMMAVMVMMKVTTAGYSSSTRQQQRIICAAETAVINRKRNSFAYQEWVRCRRGWLLFSVCCRLLSLQAAA